MKYLRILLAFAHEPWVMERHKLSLITQILLREASGEKVTRDELEAAELRARALTSRRDEIVANSDGIVAVIPVQGVLMQRANLIDTESGAQSIDILTQQFRAAVGDPNVKAIVLDVDSPGGGVYGTQEFAQELYDSRSIKPVVAQINSQAASGAYWIITQATEIVVTPGGQAGSIGVYTVHEDISKALEQEGIALSIIQNGKYKTEGNPWEPLSDEAREQMQKRVNATGVRFNADVARGRGVSVKEVLDRFGQGRMFDAEELVDRGMADRVGTIADTLERFGVVLRPSSMAKSQQRANVLGAYRSEALAGKQFAPRDVRKIIQYSLEITRSQAEAALSLAQVGKAPGTEIRVEVPKPDTKLVEAMHGLKDALLNFKLPQL